MHLKRRLSCQDTVIPLQTLVVIECGCCVCVLTLCVIKRHGVYFFIYNPYVSLQSSKVKIKKVRDIKYLGVIAQQWRVWNRCEDAFASRLDRV